MASLRNKSGAYVESECRSLVQAFFELKRDYAKQKKAELRVGKEKSITETGGAVS